MIVTGDFNAPAESAAAWKILDEGGLKDVWRTAPERVGPEIKFGDFKPPQLDRKERIDWILVQGPLRASRCETVLFNKDGRYPSDHFPVCAKLSLGD